jgi:hypothetical protein
MLPTRGRVVRPVFITIPQESGPLKRCIVGTMYALSLQLTPYMTVIPAKSLAEYPTTTDHHY